MNHRVLAFRWVSDPAPRLERQLQEAVVASSRSLLQQSLAIGELELVDPLTPDRTVGKAYVYRADDGWEVSGYYRRGESDLWHPYLLTLDSKQQLLHLKVSDTALLKRAGENPQLEILP